MVEFRPVSENEWGADCDTSHEVREGIIKENKPKDLVGDLVKRTIEAVEAQSKERAVAFYDEEVGDRSKRKYRRSCILIAIKDNSIFNQFFNGRCGYRAMYWHCKDLGADFNEFVVRSLVDELGKNSKVMRSDLFSSFLKSTSLKHNEAKIWPFFEDRFLAKGRLTVSRWTERGIRIFDPAYPALVVKGAFLNKRGQIHKVKCNRSQDIHNTGLT